MNIIELVYNLIYSFLPIIILLISYTIKKYLFSERVPNIKKSTWFFLTITICSIIFYIVNNIFNNTISITALTIEFICYTIVLTSTIIINWKFQLMFTIRLIVHEYVRNNIITSTYHVNEEIIYVPFWKVIFGKAREFVESKTHYDLSDDNRYVLKIGSFVHIS